VGALGHILNFQTVFGAYLIFFRHYALLHVPPDPTLSYRLGGGHEIIGTRSRQSEGRFQSRIDGDAPINSAGVIRNAGAVFESRRPHQSPNNAAVMR